MHLKIVRYRAKSDNHGTFGAMYIDDVFFAYTCERPVNDPSHPCIPAALGYDLIPYDSPAHGNTIVFYKPSVGVYVTQSQIPKGQAGRYLCEIHNANWPFQLQGCVAVGQAIMNIAPNGLGVTASVNTFHALQQKWGDRSNLTCDVVWDS